MDFLQQIGKRLKLIRTAAGYKQKDLAEKIEVQPALLSMYEQGKREPSLNFLRKFCNEFNFSLSQFFLFDEDTPDNKFEKDSINTLNNLLVELEKFQLSSYNKK